MAIPASELVRVQPRVLAGTGQDLAFNGLFLTENALVPVGTLLTFRDTASVSEYFGSVSNEAKAAAVYFGGYNNSFLKPTALYMWRSHKNASAPFVRSAAFSSAKVKTLLDDLKGITAGTFSATIGGTAVSLSEVDLSGSDSISAALDIVTKKIAAVEEASPAAAGVALSWNPVFRAFTLTAGAAGSTVAIANLSGTIPDALGLTSGAVVSAGADAQDYASCLDEVCETTQNFVTYSTIAEADRADALALAGWSNTQYGEGNQFLYVYWSDDAVLKTADASETAAAAIRDAEYNGVAGVFGDVRYPAFIMGSAGSIDWDRIGGTITFAFKAQSGLEANVTDKDDAANLIANGMNFVGNYASRNDNFIFLQNGQMFGQWAWIDTYLNSCWLNNALQVQILGGLQLAARVPYNEAGYIRIRAWVQDVVDRALTNGVIDRGVRLSETQKTELISEAGKDISTDLYNNGYVLQIEDATAAIRQARISPSMSFWYTYGGSVHKINLPSTAVV